MGIRIFLLAILTSLTAHSSGITVTMNADSAKALLRAIQNPSLSHDEAQGIAQMQGNQGVIRKLNEFKIAATTESFANALHAAAHGEKVTDARSRAFIWSP